MELTGIAYWVAFGNHGPRALDPPGEGKQIVVAVVVAMVVSYIIFAAIRMFAGPPPTTMNREWQEATNEYLRVCGLSSITFHFGFPHRIGGGRMG